MEAILRQHLPLEITRRRRLHSLSQAKLARLAGLSPSALNAIEGGQVRDMRVRSLLRLCVALGCLPDELLLAGGGQAALLEEMQRRERQA